MKSTTTWPNCRRYPTHILSTLMSLSVLYFWCLNTCARAWMALLLHSQCRDTDASRFAFPFNRFSPPCTSELPLFCYLWCLFLQCQPYGNIKCARPSSIGRATWMSESIKSNIEKINLAYVRLSINRGPLPLVTTPTGLSTPNTPFFYSNTVTPVDYWVFYSACIIAAGSPIPHLLRRLLPESCIDLETVGAYRTIPICTLLAPAY
jgi:hypothetical protein